MTHEEFGQYHARWGARIAALARRLSGGDRDLADDLQQVGLCALWELEVAHVTAGGDRYLWRTLRHQMIDVVRTERRAHRVLLWRPRKGVAPKPPRSRSMVYLRGTPQHWGAAPLPDDDVGDAA